AQRRTDDSLEPRRPRARLQLRVTTTAQPLRATQRYVAGPQTRDARQDVVVLPVVMGHVAYPFFSAATAGVSRSLSASAARARDRRWRIASAVTPQTAAASAGVKPSWPTSSRTSRNCGERCDSARS